MKKINVAILGTGAIANTLAKAFSQEENACLYAVGSRNLEKSKAFADTYHIPNAYGSYTDAINDKNVDLIYVATPHSMHYEQTREALLAGKNVLCEKPICVNAKQAEELFSLAKEKNLFLSEAMWTRFLPAVKTVQKLLSDGIIGAPKFLTASLAFNASDERRMTDPALAGGMLLDCGIYLITSSVLLFGKDFTDMTSNVILSDENVDLRSVTTLSYPDGKLATLLMLMDCEFEDRMMIGGETGYLAIDVPFNWQNIRVYDKNKALVETVELPAQTAGGYEYEVKAVCNAILNGEPYCKEAPPEEILFVLRKMDALREQWGVRYPFE